MFYVYILQSLKDLRSYVGYTDNFNRRFAQHNAGRVRSTKHRVPFKLLLKEEFQISAEANKKRSVVEIWCWKKKVKGNF